MIEAVKNDLWTDRKDAISEARNKIFSEYNLMKKFAQIAHELVKTEPEILPSNKQTLLRSERSFWPEPGCRGSIPETIIRSTLLFFDPKIELRASKIQKKIEARRIKKRIKKIKKLEASAQKKA
jgi:hypothetical protein